MEGAKRFVVLAAMPQAQLDDIRHAGCWQPGNQVANLPVGMVAGRVQQRGGQFDLERFCVFNQINHCVGQRPCGGRPFKCSAAA